MIKQLYICENLKTICDLILEIPPCKHIPGFQEIHAD